MHLNCRSIAAKFSSTDSLLAQLSIYILGATEAWLDYVNTNSYPRI